MCLPPRRILLDNYEKDVSGLPRSEASKLAIDEIMDVRGLSKVKQILIKYNLTNITIDFNLKMYTKRSLLYNPKKYADKEDS